MMSKPLYMCSCSGEGVAVDRFDRGEAVILSIYRLGKHSGGDWRHRLRHIFYILKEGHPYLDDIILTREAANELAQAIIAAAQEEEDESEWPRI